MGRVDATLLLTHLLYLFCMGRTINSPTSLLKIAAVSSPALRRSKEAWIDLAMSSPPQSSAPAGTAPCEARKAARLRVLNASRGFVAFLLGTYQPQPALAVNNSNPPRNAGLPKSCFRRRLLRSRTTNQTPGVGRRSREAAGLGGTEEQGLSRRCLGSSQLASRTPGEA